MTSTYTTNKYLEEPAQGDYSSGSPGWSTPLNANFTAIDVALGGTTAINVTGVSGTPVTLTTTQYRPPTVIFTGTLTANVTYNLPSGVGGDWSIYNNTSGAYTVTFGSLGGGTAVVIPQGYRQSLGCDGTNVFSTNTAPNNPAGSSGQIQYNSSGVTVGSPNLVFSGSVLSLTGSMRFYGSVSGYTGFQAANTSTSVVWTLPSADGAAGSFLQTNGAGVLTFSAAGGVTSFSAGSTGFTPSSPTGGAVALAGTLNIAHGGTGTTTATGSGAVVLANGPTLTSATLSSPTITGLDAAVGVSGIVPLASVSDTITGTSTTEAVTPAALSGTILRAYVGSLSTAPSITAGHGIASVSRTSAGRYVVNFSAALPNANFTVIATGGFGGGASISCTEDTNVARSTSSVGIVTCGTANNHIDGTVLNVVIIAN